MRSKGMCSARSSRRGDVSSSALGETWRNTPPNERSRTQRAPISPSERRSVRKTWLGSSPPPNPPPFPPPPPPPRGGGAGDRAPPPRVGGARAAPPHDLEAEAAAGEPELDEAPQHPHLV